MKVLFICVENTCRSQMAEGFARALGIEADSAGITAGAGVNPDAVMVMKEAGIDISTYKSKTLDCLDLNKYDRVISLCSAKSSNVCPATFTGEREDWNIDDPKDQPLNEFRRVRDLLDARVQNMHFQH